MATHFPALLDKVKPALQIYSHLSSGLFTILLLISGHLGTSFIGVFFVRPLSVPGHKVALAGFEPVQI